MRTSRYYFGQIVWASIFDGRRKTKNRRVLIVDDDLDYETTGEILIIPFSTSESIPCPYYHVEINGGEVERECPSLPERCRAKCDGAEYINVERLGGGAGFMPDEPLLLIREAFARLLSDRDVPWWS